MGLPTRPLAIGLLGYGAIADYHANAFHSLDVPIAAVAGPNLVEASAFATRHGIPSVVQSLDALLDDETVSAVVIASPTALHATQTRQSLEAGRHVLCEIPLATRYKDVVELGALADASDLRLMVAHTQRFQVPLRMAREAVDRGDVEPLQVIARLAMFRHENRGWTGRRRTWTDDLLWHHGAHAVDTCIWLLDSPVVSVTARARRETNDIGSPMDISVIMTTAADGMATAILSYSSRLPMNEYLIIGAKTTLVATESHLVRPPEVLFAADSDDASLISANRDQAAEFVAAILDHRRPTIGVPEIAASMQVLQAVESEVGTMSGRHVVEVA
jgi:2-hydroxy-4-carboxymuconate semialdehyde hemiacetal dehydrogenase